MFERRGPEHQGGHAKYFNSVSQGICMMGNYDTQPVDDDLVPRLTQLVRFGYSQGWWAKPRITHGHRNVPYAATSCPGKNLYPLIDEINALAQEDTLSLSQAQQDQLGTHTGGSHTPRRLSNVGEV